MIKVEIFMWIWERLLFVDVIFEGCYFTLFHGVFNVFFTQTLFTFFPRRNWGAGFDGKSNKKIKAAEKKLRNLNGSLK